MIRASRLSRVFLAAILASAMGVPASAAGDHFIKLPPADGDADAAKDGHGEQIEVHSVQWGGAPASSRSFKGETIGIEPTYESSGVSKAGGGTSTVDTNEKITIHGGRTESRLPGKRTPPTVTLKKGASRQATGDPDRPIIVGRVPNPRGTASVPETGDEVMVGMEHGDAASGQATGKRQHKPITITKEWGAATPQIMKLDRPAAKGSVWVRVATPWTACRVGARYPSLELGSAGKRYVLQEVTVASCGGSRGADDRPTEEIAFYYNRIAFNYAN